MKFNNIKIVKRKDNRYFARVTIEGKQHSIYGKTQKQCYENLKEHFKQNKTIILKTIKFYDYYKQWYETYKKPSVKEGTLKNIRSIFKNQIPKSIPNIPIKDITPMTINKCINNIQELRMREYASQYLKQLFKQAYLDKIIKIDINESIIKFTNKRKEGTALNKEQRKEFLNATYKIKDGDIFRFYLYSGARLNEALTIKKEDILKNMLHISGTKTSRSNRYIPLFNKLKEILNNRTNKDNNLIFNISEKTLKRRFNELKKIISFKFSIKDLRTTFGTMCAESGISEQTIAKWMGHTTTQTTRKYYIKILSDYEQEQANIFDTKFDTDF